MKNLEFGSSIFKPAFVAVFLAIILCFFSTLTVIAQEKGQPMLGIGKRNLSISNPKRTVININNVTSWVNGDGEHFPAEGGSWNGSFPKGTAGIFYSEGIFWGGLVNEGQGRTLRSNGHYYPWVAGDGLSAGRIRTNASGNVIGRDTVDPNIHRPYRVRPDWRTADLRNDAANFLQVGIAEVTSSDLDAMRAQYEVDWNQWPWQWGAPYNDIDKNGAYDPNTDIPGIPGASQTIWFVYNDIDSVKTFSVMDCSPIGVEVQETHWAYAASTPLSNVIFRRARIIYKGTRSTPPNATIDSMYITQWSDPDLGLWSDDFVGCDTLVSLGYAFNSTSTDPVYFKNFGLPPPAGGFDFLQGPIIPGAPTDSAIYDATWRKGFRNLPMSSFTFFSPGSPRFDPAARFGPRAPQWYNLMAGFEPLPYYPARVPLYNHLGQVTKFEVSGDPVTQTGDLDGKRTAANQNRFPAGDRRLLLSTGPFTMTRGDTQEVVVALVVGLGADFLSSINVLKFNDRFAQYAYDNLFKLPDPPPTPVVSVAELDREIILNWGNDTTKVKQIEEVTRGGYLFEGYNVYQLPTPTATLSQSNTKKIATFDVINNITVIVDEAIDVQTGVIVTAPSQTGRNSGILRYLNIKKDAVRNTPLINGQSYYFVVTAYSYNGAFDVPVHALESQSVVLPVVPQSPKPGTRYSNRSLDSIQSRHVAGFSDVASLPITVISPIDLNNATYKVSISGTQASLLWTIRNETAGQDMLTSRTFGSVDSGNLNDDFAFPIVNGFRIAVPQIAAMILSDSTGFLQPVSQVWLTSGGRFNGGPPATANFMVTTGRDLGSNGKTYLAQVASSFDPRNQVPVLLRFGPNRGQKAYRLRRTGTNTAYIIQSTNPTPTIKIEAYDVLDLANPRRITLSWRDQVNDGVYDPPIGGDGTEIIFVHYRTYDSAMSQYVHSGIGQTAIDNEVTVGAKADIMYGISCGLVSSHTLNESDIDLKIRPTVRLAAGDQYTFTTIAPSFSETAAKNDLQQINVFPNPYMGFNTREQSRLDKYVTFNHLPQKATIRIFNLGGVLLKVIQKDDASQFTRWNLRNQDNLPVASGIYVVHIEMPDQGTAKILKLAVVQEEQILNVY